MSAFIGFLIFWVVIYQVYKWIKSLFVKPLVKPLDPYLNFGDSIEVLGTTFLRGEKNFYWTEDKSMWFCQNSENKIHYYGLFPNIPLTQKEFIERLESKE